MLTTTTLWIWYVIVLVVAFIVFFFFSKMPFLTSVLCASLFSLILGLVLLPYYQTPNLSQADTLSLNIFIVVATIIPVLAILFAVLFGEHRKYWKYANQSENANHKNTTPQPIIINIQVPPGTGHQTISIPALENLVVPNCGEI
jgi:hypothetical protein